MVAMVLSSRMVYLRGYPRYNLFSLGIVYVWFQCVIIMAPESINFFEKKKSSIIETLNRLLILFLKCILVAVFTFEKASICCRSNYQTQRALQTVNDENIYFQI